MPNPRVKVRVSVLLEGAERQRAKLLPDHERATAKYEKELETWRGRVAQALCDAYERVQEGKPLPEYRYGGTGTHLLVVPVRGEAPHKPSLSTRAVDKDIAFLNAAAYELVSISTVDRFAQYL